MDGHIFAFLLKLNVVKLYEIERCIFASFKENIDKFGVFAGCLVTTIALTCEVYVVKSNGILMPTKKLRVEIFDAEGNRYTISCEGMMSRERMLHLLDLAELLGGTTEENREWRRTSNGTSKFDKVCALVKQQFPLGWFSSKEVRKVCEQELGEHLSLSTASTYLARMADRGFLMKKGPLNSRRYKILRLSTDGETNILKDK